MTRPRWRPVVFALALAACPPPNEVGADGSVFPADASVGPADVADASEPASGPDAARQLDAYTPAPSLSFSDGPSLDLGGQTIGSVTERVLTLTNASEGAASGLTGSPPAAPFAFKGGTYPGTGGTCAEALPGATTCSLVVTFAPTTKGLATGRLSLGFDGGTVGIDLAGTGVGPAALTLSDAPSFDFGSHCDGASTDRAFELTNIGGETAAALSAASLTAPFAFKGGSYPGSGGTCGSSLGGGSSCRVVVTFGPSQAGPFTGTLAFSYASAAGSQAASIGLTGTGVDASGSKCAEWETYPGSGWYWSYPRPRGNLAATAIWGSSANDVWAAGPGGTVLRWDGIAWMPVQAGTTADLSGIWTSGPSDVWAVGYDRAAAGDVALHFDGSVWSRTATGSANWLRAVWGSAPDDVWAVGHDRMILHWDGSAWSSMPPTKERIDFEAIWGTGRDDVWAVGTRRSASPCDSGSCHAAHFDGLTWSVWYLGSFCALTDVLGTGPTDVWAVGNSVVSPFEPRVHHWNGIWWSAVDAPPFQDGGSGSWGAGANDVWSFNETEAFRWDGSTWSSLPLVPAAPVRDAWGSGPNDVWTVGSEFQHWDGLAWTSDADDSLPQIRQLMGAWGSSPDDVWAVGASETFDPVAGSILRGGILHWDGSEWSALPQDPSWPEFRAIWGAGPLDVWAVGHSATYHWDGNAWSSVVNQPGGDLHGVWGSSGNDVWAVGDQATILHWDGSAWSTLMGGTTPYRWAAVWGAGPDDVWAVGADYGNQGAVVHWEGSRWSKPLTKSAAPLTAVWGSGPNDVWAVGAGGTVLHFDGTDWSSIPASTTSDLWGVRGTGPSDVWAVGSVDDGGEVLHWNGGAWSSVRTATKGLSSVWAGAAGDVWAVGGQGTILSRH